MKCGSIFCGGGGGESITGNGVVFTVSRIDCHVAVDDDKTRSLDMVPNGTRCGPNKVTRGAETRHSLSDVCSAAQNPTSVLRSASTTDVRIYPRTGRRRSVRKNATAAG